MRPLHRRQAVVAAAVAVLVSLVFALAQAAMKARNLDIGLLTRDVALLAEVKWYTGFFSNLGLMMWGGAVALGAFGWWQLRQAGATRALARALGSFAALSAFLGLDDMAQLHEDVLPSHLGIPERGVYAAEALMFLAFLVANRATLLRHSPVILAAALAGFGLSVGADLADRIVEISVAYEDGAKLIGICCWAATGATLLAAGVRPAGEA